MVVHSRNPVFGQAGNPPSGPLSADICCFLMLSQYRVVTLYTSKIIDRMGSVCYSEEVTLNERPDVEKQHIKVAAVDALKEIQFSFTT